MDYKFHLTYKIQDKIKTACEPNGDFDFELSESKNSLRVVFNPKKALNILNFSFERDYNFTEKSRFFANGYQSWTDTKEFTKNERMPGAGLIAKSPVGKYFGMKNVGDYNFVKEETEAGCFHSFSYAYVKNGEKLDLFATLDDSTGFTVIYADMNRNKLRFSKDVEGVRIEEPYEILNLYIDSGEYDEVFDRYFDALCIKPRTDEKIKGYTSWYNYYQNISEEIILRDLDSICAQKEYVNTFQVDDGYQTAVGDWMSVDDKKFPHGMKYIAERIHEKGLSAGIWLAPFGAKKGSLVAENHPDWLIRDEKGKPVPMGANWGGFYGLDIYNDDVRKYIKEVFHKIVDVWGFNLVKLDFVYAASVIPIHGKSRGEIAYDAADFLRECAGDAKILGCGVQMAPCMGKFDYMRIGADMALSWQHGFVRRNMHREDVSTPNAIHNSIYRRFLNGRAFLNDPDVFLLRHTNIKFTQEQQRLLAKFIKLFGGVLFMSDNIADYDEKQLEMFRDVLSDDAKITAVNEVNDTVFIDYEQNGKDDTLKFSVSRGDIF